MEKYVEDHSINKEYSFVLGLVATLRHDYSETLKLLLDSERHICPITVDDIRARVEVLIAQSNSKSLDSSDLHILMEDIKFAIENDLALSDLPIAKPAKKLSFRLPMANV